MPDKRSPTGVMMKILLSCVNSTVCLIGFDIEAEQAFWYCPSDRLTACGAAYDHNCDALLVASENTVRRFHASGRDERISLPGPHRNLAHSVHGMDGGLIGIADTGNSRVLMYGAEMGAAVSYDALGDWADIPEDAIHLNDFARTPHGLIVSCFHYQPYRKLAQPGYHWQNGGHGLFLSLERRGGRTVSTVAGAGFSCPHSLVWHQDRLYCCSSTGGDFIRLCYDGQIFREEKRIHVTDDHFLRGALPLADGSWLLGGSMVRRAENKGMALYRLYPDDRIEVMPVAAAGEIYDVLPWHAHIMEPVSETLRMLPPDCADEGTVYPPPCTMEKSVGNTQ